MIIRKVTSLLIAGALALSCVSAGTVLSFAGSRGNPDGVYVKQISSGKCTLASATMMLRQKSLNEGNSTWTNITQSSVRKHGWVEGVGIKQSFTYYGITVKRIDLSGGGNRDTLLELLEEHPEGIEIYDRGVPHAVLLTRYDEDEDTFYCADPGLSDQEMALGDSWLRKTYSGADQEGIIKNIDCVWVITSYTKKNIPADTASSSSSDQNEAENEDFFDDDTGNSGNSGNSSNTNTGTNTNTNTSGNTGTVTKPDNSNSSAVTDDKNSSSSGSSSGSDVLVDDSNKNSQTSGSDALKDDDAQSSGSTSGGTVFGRVRSYSTAGFSDVDLTEWYAPYVESVYETGLMSGLSGVKAGTFGVNGNMTLAQSVTIAARIYSSYAGDKETFAVKNGDRWIDPYLRYSEKKNIITAQVAASDAAALDAPVTRAQFAEIMSAAISDSECAEINTIKSNQFSDIYETGTVGRAVYRLCRAGIITGDSHGNFDPDASINRAQVAAIVARVTDKSLRVKM